MPVWSRHIWTKNRISSPLVLENPKSSQILTKPPIFSPVFLPVCQPPSLTTISIFFKLFQPEIFLSNPHSLIRFQLGFKSLKRLLFPSPQDEDFESQTEFNVKLSILIPHFIYLCIFSCCLRPNSKQEPLKVRSGWITSVSNIPRAQVRALLLPPLLVEPQHPTLHQQKNQQLHWQQKEVSLR